VLLEKKGTHSLKQGNPAPHPTPIAQGLQGMGQTSRPVMSPVKLRRNMGFPSLRHGQIRKISFPYRFRADPKKYNIDNAVVNSS
jgi:hypothetical protein